MPPSDRPTELEVTLLLCDAAQAVQGKLYILGGGWTQVQTQGNPFSMALALQISVPWDMANQRLTIKAVLLTSDGEPVDPGVGPVQAETHLEVGRPAGLEKGTPLPAMLAVNAGSLPLTPGRYVWRIEVDGEIRAQAPFQVLN